MMGPASLLRAMEGADAVVSTAAGYTRHSKGDTADIDIIGNHNLAEAASHTQVRRFVLTCILTSDLAGYLADAVDAPGVEGQRIDIGWDRPVSMQEIAAIAGDLLG